MWKKNQIVAQIYLLNIFYLLDNNTNRQTKYNLQPGCSKLYQVSISLLKKWKKNALKPHLIITT